MIMETTVFIDKTLAKVPTAFSSHMPGRYKVQRIPTRLVSNRGMQWICKVEDHSADCKTCEAQPLSTGLEISSVPAADAEVVDVFREDTSGTCIPEPVSPPLPRKSYLQRRAIYHKQLVAKKLSVIKEQVATFMGPREKGDMRDVILMSLSFAVLVYISQRLVCAYCLLRSMVQHF